MPIGMSKQVYKEMVKQTSIIASQQEPSQQQCESNVCIHRFFLCTQNLIIKCNINFQLFCCCIIKKMEHVLHIGRDDKVENYD